MMNKYNDCNISIDHNHCNSFERNYNNYNRYRYLYRNNKYFPHISKHHRNRFHNTMDTKQNKITEPSTYITNLSSKTLTTNQNRVLTLGLKFVPSSRMNKNALRVLAHRLRTAYAWTHAIPLTKSIMLLWLTFIYFLSFAGYPIQWTSQ